MAILQTGDEWDEISPFMVQGYNTTQHSAHGKTPFEVHFGKLPLIPSESPLSFVCSPYAIDDLAEQKRHMVQGWVLAQKIIEEMQLKYKAAYDKRSKEFKSKVGDFVLYRDQSKVGKLAPQWAGPFEIVEILEPNIRLL